MPAFFKREWYGNWVDGKICTPLLGWVDKTEYDKLNKSLKDMHYPIVDVCNLYEVPVKERKYQVTEKVGGRLQVKNITQVDVWPEFMEIENRRIKEVAETRERGYKVDKNFAGIMNNAHELFN